MSYSLLGQDLHETADSARAWLTRLYGARGPKCEQQVTKDLPLRPTWQATAPTGYILCVNVQPSPFSQTLHEFVNLAMQRGLPIKLWVAVPADSTKESFASELKQARQAGIGVVQFSDGSLPHEYHRAVATSLFALSRTELSKIPKAAREMFKNAEETFLGGDPSHGCQSICQDIEALSRLVAAETYRLGLWKSPHGSAVLKSRFFTSDSWATMLGAFEQRADEPAIKRKCQPFRKQLIVRTRAFTDWRNSVSHKPKGMAELKKRDSRLRTMFEATRDLLVDWCHCARPLGITNFGQ